SCIAENGNFDPFGSASQGGADNIRRGHQTVSSGVMLVENDPIKAERLGKFHLIEITIIELVALFGIIGAVRNHHPCRIVLRGELGIQMQVGHEMEEEELHLEPA